MNRRHFLKFLPLIPIAVGLVNTKWPVEARPKPAESATEYFNGNIASLDTLLAREKLMKELILRSHLPAPVNGCDYSKEEMEIITAWIRPQIELKMLRGRVQELLRQKVLETLAGVTPAL